jgi:hypothetical protein
MLGRVCFETQSSDQHYFVLSDSQITVDVWFFPFLAELSKFDSEPSNIQG